MKHTRAFFLAMVLAVAVPSLLCADPPSVVGRLSLASGDVSFRPGSIDEWVPAIVNYPLTAGDDLWVDNGGRAEVHVGSTALRVGPDSSLSFLNLDDDIVQVSLTDGSLSVSVHRALEGSDIVEIDTPNAVYTLIRPGNYRVNVSSDYASNVVVRSGAVVVTTAGESFTVNAGQTGTVSGADSVAYFVERVIRSDGWDSWCASREAREEGSVSLRYVSREMIGVQDLDDAGTWVMVAGYGTVWTPSHVPSGWAPYRYGRWAWVSPWGWTWIDDAPWGFAPFHYGRWAYAGNRWVWVPGAVAARPVYAPALVVFIGGDGSSVENVTWFPLAPREVYVPAYTVSVTYIRRINIDHVENTRDIERVDARRVVYANQRVPQAVTMVPRPLFVASAPVARGAVQVTGRNVEREPVLGMGVSIAPQRESVIGQSLMPNATVRRPPANVQDRSVYTRTTPAAQPQPFVQGRAVPAQTSQPQPRQDAGSGGATGGRTVQSGVTLLTPASRGRTQPAQGAPTQTPPAARTQNTPDNRGNANPPSNQADQNRARNLISTLQNQTLPQVEARLDAARKNRNVTLDYNTLTRQIASARAALADAERDLQAGRTDQAMQKAQAVQKQLIDIQKIIDDATKSAGGGTTTTQPGRSGQQGQQGQQGQSGPVVKPARKP
jgi:hypothetical protein